MKQRAEGTIMWNSAIPTEKHSFQFNTPTQHCLQNHSSFKRISLLASKFKIMTTFTVNFFHAELLGHPVSSPVTVSSVEHECEQRVAE